MNDTFNKDDQKKSSDEYPKLNRSFARRIGKSLNVSKKHMVEHELPKRVLKLSNVTDQIKKHSNQPIIMEIGYGMGEHFFNQIINHQDKFFIGAEVYMNGVAQLLEKICDYEAEHNIELNNFILWPDDVDILLEQIPNESLDQLYILFPDPWPKRKHHKKRLIGEDRLPIIKSKLKHQGTLAFASDIDHYFDAVIDLIENDQALNFINKDFNKPHDGYVNTKYHKKAIREGRTPRFMQITKTISI